MTSLPARSNTTATATSRGSDDDFGGIGDPSSATGLLQERLQAWKHMCGYLEDYIGEVAKMEKSRSKDQEKILKTLSNPLKEGHHFDTAIGGVSGLFENLRANTQAQSNLHVETNKNLTGQVLPILERLHAEIKNKSKELTSGAGKGSKAVDSARQASQKHIDALGAHSASFDSAGGKGTAASDPYILQRQIYHRLNRQILEENSNRQDVIAVQSSFAEFEAHVLTAVQQALTSFNTYMGAQCDREKAMFGDVASTAGNMPLDFEWNGFLQRNSSVLVNPNAPARTMEGISFPNQNHRATKPLIEGSLERKSRGGIGALTGYKSNYYAVTGAGFLHEFKDNDNFQKDPVPEVSLYLPDTTIGAADGQKFTIKGKDSSGSKISQKMSLNSEYQFKAHTAADAQAWHNIIAEISTGTGSLPTSPVESRNVTPVASRTEKGSDMQSPAQAGAPGIATVPEHQQMQTSGIVGGEKSMSPISPQNAGPGGFSSASPTAGQGSHFGGGAPASQPAGTGALSGNTGTSGPLSAEPQMGGQGSHFHGAPAQNDLAERQYVQRQG